MVSLKEYFIEEFEGKKPEEYRTQVPMAQIDSMFTCRLRGIGIADSCVRVVEVGDYGWRNEGKPFCISKCYDVTLNDFATIDSINAAIDRRWGNSNVTTSTATGISAASRRWRLRVIKPATWRRLWVRK